MRLMVDNSSDPLGNLQLNFWTKADEQNRGSRLRAELQENPVWQPILTSYDSYHGVKTT